MGAIFRREIGAYFNSSIAYVFLAVFFVYSGFPFGRQAYWHPQRI